MDRSSGSVRKLRLPPCRSTVDGFKNTLKHSTSTPVRTQTTATFIADACTIEQDLEVCIGQAGLQRTSSMSAGGEGSESTKESLMENVHRSQYSICASESFNLDMIQPLDLSLYSASSDCSFSGESPWKRHSMVEFTHMDSSLDSNCSAFHDESISSRQKLLQKLRRRSDALKMKDEKLKNRYARLKQRQKILSKSNHQETMPKQLQQLEDEPVRPKNKHLASKPPRPKGLPPLPGNARILTTRFSRFQLPQEKEQSSHSTSTAGCTPWPNKDNKSCTTWPKDDKRPLNDLKNLPHYRGMAHNMTLELELIKQSISKTRGLVSNLDSCESVLDFSLSGGRHGESELFPYPVTFLKNGKKCTWC